MIEPAAQLGLPQRPWARDVSAGVPWVLLTTTTAMWIAHGGVPLLRTFAGATLSLGRLSALLSSTLLVILILSMARVPWVERAWGQERLVRIHRRIASASLVALVLHIVLSILGNALNHPDGLALVVNNFLADSSGLLAIVATVIIVIVLLTSIPAVRRKMSYAPWFAAHLYAYAGIFLALPHQFLLGSNLRADIFSTLYWGLIWVLAVMTLVIFRFVLPARRSGQQALTVSHVATEAPGTVSIFLTGPRLSSLAISAGQYAQWRFEHSGRFLPAIALYVSAMPNGQFLRLTATRAGSSFAKLSSLKPGARVKFSGPLGRTTAEVRTRSRVTFIAAGVGIAPIRSLMESIQLAPGEGTLIYRAHDPERFTLNAEIDALAQDRGISVFYVPGPRDSQRDTWLPVAAQGWNEEEALRRLVPDIHTQDVYVSGTSGWLRNVVQALQQAGVPEDRIHQLPLEWM